MGLTRSELYTLWQADAGGGRQNKDRPAVVREYRDDLAEYVDTGEPVPDESAALAEFARWLDAYKGTVTRQLNDDADETDPHDAEGDDE